VKDVPETVLTPRRNRSEKFLLHFRNLLWSAELAIDIPRRKYFKNFQWNDGNSDFFTNFAIPKIGFFSPKRLVFRVLDD